MPYWSRARLLRASQEPGFELVSQSLYVKDGKVFVQDVGNRTGTFVKGQRVQHERELQHGDRLPAGPLVFEVRLENTLEIVRQATQRNRGRESPAGA
ncbi:MAG: FHA domain-containing protein [Rhodopirellula sp.]|nr:FHA domain-containing protein [Rhodopirellula sp.]